MQNYHDSIAFMWQVVQTLKKTNGHNTSRLPWGRGMVFKGWWNNMGVCIKDGFMFFLEQYVTAACS